MLANYVSSMYTFLDDSKLAQSELIIMDKVKVTQSCLTLFTLMDYAVWNSPGRNTGVSSLSLLSGIFPTQ